MNFANAKTEVLKEPRGFIKIIQFFFSILAFACLVDWKGTLKFDVSCKKANGTIVIHKEYEFEYPFAMDEVKVPVPLCKPDETQPDKTKPEEEKDFEVNATSSSQFFVFIGVVSFFASLIICAGYILYEDVYLSSPRYAWGDIIFHGVLAFLWFVSSCAYAAHIGKIKKYSSSAWALSQEKDKGIGCTKDEPCKMKQDPTFANLDIAALCGFVNVFLWGANIWFLYKETRQSVAEGDFVGDMQQDSPQHAPQQHGGYEPYGPGSSGTGGGGGQWGAGSGTGAGAGGGQWGAGQSAVQGGMNEI